MSLPQKFAPPYCAFIQLGEERLYEVYTEREHDHELDHCHFPRDFPLERSNEPPLIQNAVIRAVTVAMCAAAMHHLMEIALHASDTDSDDILAFYLFTRRRRRKRRYRRISVHPFLQKCQIYNPTPCAINFHGFFFFSASLKSRRPLRYKIGCFSTSTISSSVLSDMLLTGALQSQIFYAYRVSPGLSYTKTKELFG